MATSPGSQPVTAIAQPSSSAISRTSAASGVSPGSTLPPGNSQRPAVSRRRRTPGGEHPPVADDRCAHHRGHGATLPFRGCTSRRPPTSPRRSTRSRTGTAGGSASTPYSSTWTGGCGAPWAPCRTPHRAWTWDRVDRARHGVVAAGHLPRAGRSRSSPRRGTPRTAGCGSRSSTPTGAATATSSWCSPDTDGHRAAARARRRPRLARHPALRRGHRQGALGLRHRRRRARPGRLPAAGAPPGSSRSEPFRFSFASLAEREPRHRRVRRHRRPARPRPVRRPPRRCTTPASGAPRARCRWASAGTSRPRTARGSRARCGAARRAHCASTAWPSPWDPRTSPTTRATDRLWTVTEHPHRRWVLSIRRSRFGG